MSKPDTGMSAQLLVAGCSLCSMATHLHSTTTKQQPRLSHKLLYYSRL